MLKLKLLLLALTLAGCTPPTPQPPDASTYDGGLPDASVCSRACSNLLALGCTDMGTACTPTCEHVVDARLTPFDPQCVASATTRPEVRRCPAVRCEDPK